jgi:metal-dependent amidase/aminoacylase/carboxypeptidase family protein
MTFHGQPAHAAAAPWDGNSALTACLQTFNLIDSQRVHFRDGVRVHGYITDGGQAVNIIPERAACEFSVRAKSLESWRGCGPSSSAAPCAGAMAAGVEVTIAPPRVQRHAHQPPLARAFAQHITALGRPARETDERVGMGSTDMGDVSHAVPSIHPWLAICDVGETLCHQHAFARAACAERGLDTMLTAARAMAKTGGEFLVDEGLQRAVRAAFERR